MKKIEDLIQGVVDPNGLAQYAVVGTGFLLLSPV
jgi:hypothetical protein